MGVALALGGHGPPMRDVVGRIGEIRKHHEARLQAVLEAVGPSAMIVDVADKLFPAANGYHRLLALEEVGAHIEFLRAQRLVRRAAAGRVGGPDVFQRRRAAHGAPGPVLRPARPPD